MEKVFKEPSVAGMFYTDEKDALQKQIDGFKLNCKRLRI